MTCNTKTELRALKKRLLDVAKELNAIERREFDARATLLAEGGSFIDAECILDELTIMLNAGEIIRIAVTELSKLGL